MDDKQSSVVILWATPSISEGSFGGRETSSGDKSGKEDVAEMSLLHFKMSLSKVLANKSQVLVTDAF